MKVFVVIFALTFLAACGGGKGLEPVETITNNTNTNTNNNETIITPIIPEINTFTVNDASTSQSIPYNTAATIKWSSSNAVRCTLGSSTNPNYASGLSNPGFSSDALTNNLNLSLRCVSSTNHSVEKFLSVMVTTPIIPTITSFTINGSSTSPTIPYNTAATIRWSSANATGCTLASSTNPNFAFGTASPASGVPTGLLTSNLNLTLKCLSSTNDLKEASLTAMVTTPVIPTITSFTINGSSVSPAVPYNTAATIKWSSANAASCTLASTTNPNLSSGISNTTGVSSGSLTSNVTFTLRCLSSTNNSVNASLTAIVTTPIIPVITSVSINNQTVTPTIPYNTTAVPYGTAATIKWTSSKATSCALTTYDIPGFVANGVSSTGVSTGLLTRNVNLALECFSSTGDSTEQWLTVMVAPSATGRWINGITAPGNIVNNTCEGYCGSQGLLNVASPEGLHCSSQENPIAAPYAGAISVGPYCYRTGQMKDNDLTDKTVACYCK
jgi:hypothetical protein